MKYLLLFIFLLIPAASAQAVWFDSSWTYRVKVEVIPSKVATSSAITDFPVYVSLGDLPAEFWSNAQSDGDDIRVVESDEVTETPFELVRFETASSSGELHFLADSLATTSTSTFYIYYGNAGASGYASTSAYGSQNVWNANYRAVWHLSESATTTARAFKDSTDYDNAGTGVSLSSSNTVAGKVGYSVDFDGSADYISFANESNFDFERTDSFSGSVWVSIDSAAAANVVVGKINDSGCYNGWEFWLDGSRRPLLILGNCYPSNQLEVRSDTGAPTTAWTHLAWSYSGGSAPSNILLYINGQLSATTTTFNSLSSTILNNASAYVGRRTTSWPFNGRKDEVRVASAVLSPAWFQTEFNNHSTTTSFYVIGAQTTNSGGGGGTPTTTVEVFSTPGSYNWQASTSTVFVQCWGGGGGGGDGTNDGGAGGGGGAYAAATTTVVASNVYTITIGAGGSGATSAAGSGFNGATSSFATTTVVAAPGRGGGGTAGAGGLGGQAGSSTGDVTFSGGTGGTPNTSGDTGGGGGGAAGPGGAGGTGNNGTGSIGGAGGTGNNGTGGAGGIGVTTTYTALSTGATASTTGGGGGGGGDNGTRGGDAGFPGGGGGGGEANATAGHGDGGNGQCILTYTTIIPDGGSSTTPQSVFWFN